MNDKIIQHELKLKYPIFAITRVNSGETEAAPVKGCVYQLFDAAAEHRVTLHAQTVTCPEVCVGCGFVDGIPDIPGGFGHFLSKGRGEGFPAGERIKCRPEVAESMLLSQPQNVMASCHAIEIEPYKESLKPDLILFFVTPDQLSGLLPLFYYRTADSDRVIVPMSSDCAQLFGIPFGKLKKERPRAVPGNTDFFQGPTWTESYCHLPCRFQPLGRCAKTPRNAASTLRRGTGLRKGCKNISKRNQDERGC